MADDKLSLYGFEKYPYTLRQETQDAVDEAYREDAGIPSIADALYKLRTETMARFSERPDLSSGDINFFKKISPIGIAYNHGVILTKKYLENEPLIKMREELENEYKDLKKAERALKAREKALEKREKALVIQEKALIKMNV